MGQTGRAFPPQTGEWQLPALIGGRRGWSRPGRNLETMATAFTPARGEIPKQMAERFLLELDGLCEEEGWDQPASLWVLRWADASPHLVAEADQRAASLRDFLTGPEGATPNRLAAGAIEVSLLAHLPGHPYNAMIGERAPANADAAALVTEGWDYPDDVKQSGVPPSVPPSQHPRRVEVRLAIMVDRSGALHGARRVRGGRLDWHETGLEGRVPDALRRVMGVGTPPPDEPPALLLARVWAERVASLPEGASWDDVAGCDPAVKMLTGMAELDSAELEDDAPAEVVDAFKAVVARAADGGVGLTGTDRDRLAEVLVGGLTWEAMHALATARADDASRRELEWMDAPMAARTLLSQHDSLDDSLEVAALRHGRHLADRLAGQLARRGWVETDRAGKREAGRSRRTRRNDPCPCGSGRKYKHCHGGPAPLIIDPSC